MHAPTAAMTLVRRPALLLLVCVSLLFAVPSAEATSKPDLAGQCRLQEAQSFLKRESFVKNGELLGPDHTKAIRFRVKHYGRVEGLDGFDELNPKTAFSQAVTARFMGHSVLVHRKIAPVLRCVERRIRRTCSVGADRYVPSAIGGFRKENSYRGGEISNHLFGIAVDIDPDRNPCCGCVDPWPDHPACKGPASTVYERTALPRCWVHAFERYGFYWLGRDKELRDTMHFEFLGDPDRIAPP
jgi:hypothetical protein